MMTDWFPIDLGYPSAFPERGPGTKAISPLSLEPRDVLWLHEMEETKRAAAQSSVRVHSLASLRLSGLRCTAPYPSASLPTRWMSFRVVGVTLCD